MKGPLRIQQMRQFVITQGSGSFRAAASGTFRSQAAVSTAMRDLERQIGAQLFEKGRRAKLTPLAEMIYPLFRELLTVHDRIIGDVNQLVTAERGSVSLGVVPFLSEEWLPAFLNQFVARYPDVQVRVTDQRSHQIRSLVADGTVDIGVASWLPEDAKLGFRPVATDAFGVMCASSHPIARGPRPVSWNALREERMVGNASFELLKGCGLGAWIEDPSISVNSRSSLMECIRAGLGITVLPMLTGPSKAEGLSFIPLARPRITRTVGIITRKEQTFLPVVAAMHEMIEVSLKSYASRRGAVLADRERDRTRSRAKKRKATNEERQVRTKSEKQKLEIRKRDHETV